MRVALTALLLLLLAFVEAANKVAAVPVGVGSSFNLQPLCASRVYSSGMLNEQYLVAHFTARILDLSCFSFSFVQPEQPDTGAHGGSGTCTESMLLAGTAYVDITPADPSSQVESYTLDLGRMIHGSTMAVRMEYPVTMRFAVQLRNPMYNQCAMTAYATISATAYSGFSGGASDGLPFVVVASPIVMYRRADYTITFRTPRPTATSQRGSVRVVIIPTTKLCSADAEATWTAQTKPQLPVWINSTAFSWTAFVENNGLYDVCITTDSGTSPTWTPAALVEAYGANPAFFDRQWVLTPPNSLLQQIFVFYGHALDPAQDELRLVDSVAHGCGSNPVASPYTTVGNLAWLASYTQGATTPAPTTAAPGASSPSNQLSAEGAVGVPVGIHRGGTYYVCYYHAAAREWVDVPDFSNMQREAIANTSDADQQAQNHIGQQFGVGVTCKTAPLQKVAYVSQNLAVILTLLSTSMPASFPASVATLLCLPHTDNVVVLALESGNYSTTAYSSASSGKVVPSVAVRLAVLCGLSCESDERMVALLRNAHKLMNVAEAQLVFRHGIEQTWSPSTAAPAGNAAPSDGDSDAEEHRKWLLRGGIAAGSVIVLLGLLVVGLVVRHRRLARQSREPPVVEASIVEPLNDRFAYGQNSEVADNDSGPTESPGYRASSTSTTHTTTTTNYTSVEMVAVQPPPSASAPPPSTDTSAPARVLTTPPHRAAAPALQVAENLQPVAVIRLE